MKYIANNPVELVSVLNDLTNKDKWPLTLNVTEGGKRSLSQNALSHCIYAELSKYLIGKGRKDCTPAWVKMMLKYKFLGFEDVQYTDIKSGNVDTRQQLKQTSKLDKGEMVHYLTQIIEWADSIGCMVKIPADSDYMKFIEQQNQ